MAAPISGVDALLTLEAQAARVMTELALREKNVPEATRPDNVQISYDLDNGTMTLTAAALPFVSASAAAGGLTFTPGVYLTIV